MVTKIPLNSSLNLDQIARKKSSKKDQPPLLVAAAKGRQGAVLTLPEYGADVNLIGGKCSPLDYAKERLDFLLFTRGNPNYNLAGDEDDYYFLNVDDDDYDDEKPFMDMVKRKIKLEAVWSLDNEEHLAKSQVKDVFDQFELECYAALRLMKLKKIRNMDLTFYDIMKKSPRAMAKLMRNENVVEAYKSEDYTSEFPIYARMLTGRFGEALDECVLDENAHQVLMFLFKNLPELSIECIEKIRNNLLVADLWRLASDNFQTSFSTV